MAVIFFFQPESTESVDYDNALFGEGVLLNIDKSNWVYQPQLTIQRHRYRGQIESIKVNQEANQFRFDVAKLRRKQVVFEENYNTSITRLLDGGLIDGLSVTWVDSLESFDAVGILDLLRRIESLDARLSTLEKDE